MPGGYERSPDYGGPEPSWMFWVAMALCVIFAATLIFFYAPEARGQERSEIYLLHERCAKRAEELFDKDFPKDQRKGLEIFRNHYHIGLNKCFMLEENIIFGQTDGKPYRSKSLVLVDVNDNRIVGSFDTLECVVGNQKCHSEQEFRTLIKTFLDE
jgi:hypothetical protein